MTTVRAAVGKLDLVQKQFDALQTVANEFTVKHGREPKLWIAGALQRCLCGFFCMYRRIRRAGVCRAKYVCAFVYVWYGTGVCLGMPV